jgi:predicted alpha/beta superfamily hydrolase
MPKQVEAPARRRALRWLTGLGLGGAASARGSGAAEVEFTIDLRDEIAAGRFAPLRQAIGVRGAVAPLSWERSLLARPGNEPGVFFLRLRFDRLPAQPVPYKFKVETARSERLDDQGLPVETAASEGGWESGPNRTFGPLQAGQLLRVSRAFGSQPDAPPPLRSGHIERIPAQPSRFVSGREVQVWLPPAYGQRPEERWPVLYLHDGQNVFDAVAAGAEWQFDEVAQRLTLAGSIRPPIIVAVASNQDRLADYTPWPRTHQGQLQGGHAAAYGRYLVEELKPMIDQRYRTRPGRVETAVGGSSMGGLVSLWLLLEHAATFGAGLVVSPSMWWAPAAFEAQLRTVQLPFELPPPRVWVCAGGREGVQMVQGARRLREALQQRGWAPGGVEQPDGGHDEASWAARVEPMLRFLYGV